MHFQNVCLEGFGYVLPDEIVTSAELEERLEPLYERLRLPAGRLELMTGIRERRFWEPGTLPSQVSVQSALKALENTGVDKEHIGALIHGSVCRDVLEPATASRVHRGVGLPHDCVVYDVSNACLGVMNGMVQIATMIELGQIRAGIVVGTEGSRQLVEATIDLLNRDTSLTRRDIKLAVASLTIGSASVAAVLVDRELSRTGNLLSTAVAFADTDHVDLCCSGPDETVEHGMRPIMRTDSERLMEMGLAAGAKAFPKFLAASGWEAGDLDKTVMHQVGTTHRKMMLEGMGLRPERDFATLQWLGNTGSAALPVTTAIAEERGFFEPQDRIGMMGIGSGINVLMLGIQWQRSLLAGQVSDSQKLQSTPSR